MYHSASDIPQLPKKQLLNCLQLDRTLLMRCWISNPVLKAEMKICANLSNKVLSLNIYHMY